ncbi:MAG: outer membrane lipoprotein carrier protein LolA [Betaproteobacteria bacterium RIFCSPLOWO2_12_FULL_68_20]|nr:MAG: outer membrane lipoprotein carrier protein LolA [Betaproteobacteria bacterium RIFCSPLOWO2_12_FULL_68_20]
MRLIALVAVLAASPAQAAGIERFEAFLRTTQSASAGFEQKVFDRGGKLVQESKGSFAFLRPGRFRWTYDSPVKQVIVGDGERVWIHDPDLNQVTVRRLSRALGSTPAALLAGSSQVREAFEFSDAGQRDGLEWLEAKPRERESGFERIRLGLSVSGVEAMELADHFGQTTVLRFSGVVRNPRLDTAQFRFQPPQGADVLGEP